MLYLYHYFERERGSFRNLSDLSVSKAREIQSILKTKGETFAAKRNEGYLERRRYLEKLVREMFTKKGGQPVREVPHYMVIGECPWLATWYSYGDYIKIPVTEFDMKTVSFTYGDMFPTFSEKINDGLEYRGQVYTFEEIFKIIEKYGLPQDTWDMDNPVFAQPCYVEAQIWSDEVIERYKSYIRKTTLL